jgi:CubicO group peptidase (beta-lactamase class C family)
MKTAFKWLTIALAALIAAAGIGWLAIGKDWRTLVLNTPTGQDVLFWDQDQRDAGFRYIDRIPSIIESREIANGDDIYHLPKGEPLKLRLDVKDYMKSQNTSAIVIIHNGEVRMERYGIRFNKKGRWTSFSVAKSLTSTLVGAAIKDGYINSVDDIVSDYIPALKGSAYDDVTVAQLLTMTSGVAWNEDYSDPNSDVATFTQYQPAAGTSAISGYMSQLGRAHPAGEVWNYSTGETNLIGVLVSEATGKTVADYLSEKIWAPYGMEAKATWLLGADNHELSGCCIQARTRDMARFGQFILDGAKIDGVSIVPDGWVETATQNQIIQGDDTQGYGYQWWTSSDGTFAAQGIFGQGIFIDPARNLVIASNSNWPTAVGPKAAEREAFYRTVQARIDAEDALK